MPVYPTADAEKCVIRELWKDTATAESNDWTLIGSPTVNNGVVLNGTTQRATHPLYSEFRCPDITIVVDFTPDFDYDANADYAFFDCSNGSRYLISKRNNANNNFILVMLGNVAIVNITTAQYAAYWKVGERNTIIVSGASGNTDVWLNGVKVVDSDPSAWTPKYPSAFYLGSSYTGSSLFDGTIHELHIFADRWNDTQVDDWSKRTTFSFQDRADVYVDMDIVLGDGSGDNLYRVVDKTKHTNDPLRGLGTNLVNSPVYLNPGFEFDGVTAKYLEWVGQSGFYDNTEQTIVAAFTPYFHTDNNVDRYLFDSANGSRYLLIKRLNAQANVLIAYMGNTALPSVPEASYKPLWRTYGRNVVIVSGTSGYNNLWLNGFKLLDGASTAWTPDDPSTIQIGTYYGKNNYRFYGIVHHFSTYSFLLSNPQAAMLTRLLQDK